MYEHDDESGDLAGDDVALRSVPDLRGVSVEDATGLTVGELFGALAEVETGLVRYVDLSLAASDRHVLVPIGHTRVRQQERDGPRIRLRAALLEELEQIPPFPADVSHVDDPFERSLLEAYGRTFHGERYYAHPSYDHHGIYAGDHPVLFGDGGEGGAPVCGSGETVLEATGPEYEGARQLRRLSYLPGWRVARGEPDIRGWTLMLDDSDAASVRDLIIEPAAGKVRYVVVETTDGQLARLLPVGFLHVDEGAGAVRAPGLHAADLQALPDYGGGGVTREEEDRLCAVLRRRLRGHRRYHLPDFRPDAQAGGS
jgi:hypothetical protein